MKDPKYKLGDIVLIKDNSPYTELHHYIRQGTIIESMYDALTEDWSYSVSYKKFSEYAVITAREKEKIIIKKI